MEERAYLRNELNSRIMLTYTHSHTTMTFVISVWSLLITLLSLFHETILEQCKIVFLIAPIIVLITLFYIFFASQKYRENLVQIIKISSYYSCFFNSVGLPSESCDAWELITMDMANNKEYALNKDEEVLPRMNGEYVFFAIAACIINVILFAVFAVLCWLDASISYGIVLFVEAISIMWVSVFLVQHISTNTSLQRYNEEHAAMFANWLKYAVQHGYITKEEVNNRYSNMNDTIKEKLSKI